VLAWEGVQESVNVSVLETDDDDAHGLFCLGVGPERCEEKER